MFGSRSSARPRERGSAAVEMALVLPVLLLAMGGIVDFGRLFMTQIVITNAAREGARVAITSGSSDPSIVAARVRTAAGGVDTATMVVSLTVCPTSSTGGDARVSVTVPSFDWVVIGGAARFFNVTIPRPSVVATSVMRCGG